MFPLYNPIDMFNFNGDELLLTKMDYIIKKIVILTSPLFKET